MLPPDIFETSSVSFSPGFSFSRNSLTCPASRGWKTTDWHLDLIVGMSRSASVVMRIMTELGGGSSRVFRNAFWALKFILCAPSIMKTL